MFLVIVYSVKFKEERQGIHSGQLPCLGHRTMWPIRHSRLQRLCVGRVSFLFRKSPGCQLSVCFSSTKVGSGRCFHQVLLVVGQKRVVPHTDDTYAPISLSFTNLGKWHYNHFFFDVFSRTIALVLEHKTHCGVDHYDGAFQRPRSFAILHGEQHQITQQKVCLRRRLDTMCTTLK